MMQYQERDAYDHDRQRIYAFKCVDEPWPVAYEVTHGNETRRYVPEPPTCTIEPHGYYDEQHGMYTCSNCGLQWQFDCDGPKENGWTCCPKCRARIKEEAE